jgi:hypothetical protein
MKKFLLLMVAILFAISAIGQPVNKKTQSIGFTKQESSVNFHKLLTKGLSIDSSIHQSWDGGSSAFVTDKKTKFIYGAGTMEQTDSLWWVLANKWHATQKTDYIIDANGDPTSEITSTSDISLDIPVWVKTDKTERIFDINSNLTLYTTYSWNGTLSQWDGIMQIETTFDINGNPVLEVTRTWNTPTLAWIDMAKTESSYDGSGNITTSITYVWDSTIPTPAFVNSSYTDYTFNGGGQKVQYISYTWDKTLAIPAWVNSSKTDLGYDLDGNINLMTSYDWDETLATPDWVGSMQMESTYDINRNQTMFTVYMWDTDLSAWVGMSRTEATFGNVYSTDITFDEMTGFSWDAVGSQWVAWNKTFDYYTDKPTIINKISEKNLRVYPNPAREFIVFDNLKISESATITVFDIQGRKVMQKQLSGNNQISVSNLPKGLYLYKLNNGGTAYSGRLVKR